MYLLAWETEVPVLIGVCQGSCLGPLTDFSFSRKPAARRTDFCRRPPALLADN